MPASGVRQFRPDCGRENGGPQRSHISVSRSNRHFLPGEQVDPKRVIARAVPRPCRTVLTGEHKKHAPDLQTAAATEVVVAPSQRLTGKHLSRLPIPSALLTD